MENAIKKPFYKKWWFWVIVVVVFAAIGSSQTSKQPAQNTTPTPQPATTTQQPAPAETQKQPEQPKEEVIKITASQLYDAYSNNQLAADEKYKGKTVEVTGIVGEIGKDLLNSPYVMLEASNPYLGIQCFLTRDEASKATSLKKGQKATLTGTVDGKVINVSVKNCSIVK